MAIKRLKCQGLGMLRILITFSMMVLLASCGSIKQNVQELLDKSNNLDTIDLAPKLTVRTLSANTGTWNDVLTNSAEILAAEIAILEAKREVDLVKTARGLQLNSTIQAGSMSLNDEKNGALGTLNIDQLISDFGQTDAQILQANANVELSKLNYLKVIEEELLTAALALNAWETGYELVNLTYSKQVLAQPLIDNLRRLSGAGQIDTIQLATAEQTFSQLELTKIKTLEAVKKAEITLDKFFEKTPDKLKIDVQDVNSFADELGNFDPRNSLTYRLAKQKKAMADLALLTHKASNRGTLVARSKLDVPAADNMDADASVGILYSKILRDGGRHEKLSEQLEARVRLADAQILAAKAELRTRHNDLTSARKTAKATKDLRNDLIINVQNQISQLENQLAIGSTSFNELLSSHIELYQLQREEIETASELRRINLELIAIGGRLPKVMDVRLLEDLEN